MDAEAQIRSFAGKMAAARSHEEAQAVVQEALAAHANDPPRLKRLAEVLSQAGRVLDAKRLMERYVTIVPEEFAGWLFLAKLHSAVNDGHGAIECARQSIRIAEGSAEAHRLLATSLADKGLYAEAAEQYQHAIELDPDDSVALSALGAIRQRQGDFKEAIRLLRAAVELRPTNGYAQLTLMRSSKATEKDVVKLARLEALAADPSISKYDRLGLYAAAAKGWEDLGEYEKAMVAYDASNAVGYELWLGGKAWDRTRDQRFFSKVIENFPLGAIRNLQREGSESRLPVLIAGMPRSGTSLVEQIVSSHPDVSGAGELDFWLMHAGRVLSGPDRSVNRSELSSVADEYLHRLRANAFGAARVTDKMPQNYALLGMVCAAFKNCRVIHVRRNPIDTCLSVYTTPFGVGMPFTHRREDVLFAYREYLRVMDHWRTVLAPEQLYEVDYEDVVADREAVARRIVEFVGLPWSAACLKHEENDRLVHTASNWQVRQPIYTSSVSRWVNFKPWISEFLELGD